MDGGGREVGSNSGRFPILQANSDPESNWEVDVAKSLEEYLLKILLRGGLQRGRGPLCQLCRRYGGAEGRGFVLSVGVCRAGMD